jgi:chromosome segregation ATPase
MSFSRAAAALCALALALPPVAFGQAAAPKSKSLGGGRPAGKLLTRNELRACMKLQDDLKQMRAAYEPARAEHERRQAALRQGGDALKAERAALDQKNAELVAAQNAKTAAHGERIAAWNTRNAALAEKGKAGRGTRSEFEAEQKALEEERVAINQAGEALKAETETLRKQLAEQMDAYNAKAEARNKEIEAFNAAAKPVADQGDAVAEAADRWKNECADRPYKEDDEIIIKAGK